MPSVLQSGITVSDELHTAFKSLISDSSQRGLLVSISKAPEALIPAQTIPSTASDFSADLSNLESHISDNVASYIILKQDKAQAEGIGSCVLVTYVPDKAPVRQKMLFASTRLTLTGTLGTEHFSDTQVFATDPSDLTATGWAKHESHGSLSAPLTQDEKNLVEIREAEAQESTGTATRRGGHVQSGVSLPANDAAKDALEKLAKGELALVQLKLDSADITKGRGFQPINAPEATQLTTASLAARGKRDKQEIDIPNEQLALASTHAGPLSPADLHKQIAADAPRYSFYAHSAPSSETKFLFIYTNPPTTSTKVNIKARMLYASSRASTERTIAPAHGVNAAGKLEAGDPEDITEADVLSALGVAGDAAQGEAEGDGGDGRPAGGVLGRGGGFARPKKPGKR